MLFFNDTATTEIYTYGHTLSLHDALPISAKEPRSHVVYELIGTEGVIRYNREDQIFELRNSVGTRHMNWQEEKNFEGMYAEFVQALATGDRKSTRLNSSH